MSFFFSCAWSLLLCWLFSSWGEQVHILVHIVVAFRVAEHRLQGTWASVVAAGGPQSTGSWLVAHRLSCFMACGIFPDQGLNLCLLHWQQILYHWDTSVCVCVCPKSPQSCPTLCNPVVCSLPGSSVHGILQARILEWGAISFSRGPSPPRDGTCVSYVSCIGRQVLYH